MATSKAQQKATAKYMKNNYDEIKTRVPKGKKAEIQAAAEKQGESLNAYVIGAVERRMKAEQDKENTAAPDIEG
ncbi:MAG: toxin-antitoxin system HicB family antitoxin [Oscillospiraceae bacterium]